MTSGMALRPTPISGIILYSCNYILLINNELHFNNGAFLRVNSGVHWSRNIPHTGDLYTGKAFHFYTWNTRNAVKHADYQ
jgi:hypothetical protein